jgi:hypothetical protein
MIEYMLADVIGYEFERVAGKDQLTTGRALHVGFGMSCTVGDQYNVSHMYIYAPHNYVYVAVQQERIDKDGGRHVGPMEILAYHDSCWRDALCQWLIKNSAGLLVFNAFALLEWRDVITLTEAERRYLNDAERWRRDNWELKKLCLIANPFDKRGIWAKKDHATKGA